MKLHVDVDSGIIDVWGLGDMKDRRAWSAAFPYTRSHYSLVAEGGRLAYSAIVYHADKVPVAS